MQALDHTNDGFPRALQALADLMSQHTDDRDFDGRTWPQYEEELDTLRLVQRHLERRVASVSRKRNTFVPVNILPPELLVAIFKITVDDEDGMEWSIHEKLVLVCQYWNHLVHNTPSLWTKIRKTIASPNAKVIHALQKSQDSPLEIECDLAYKKIETVGGNAFLSAILPHAHRWRKATFRLEKMAALESMTPLSAPLLESLSLFTSVYSGMDQNKPLDIGDWAPPRLQEVSLARIYVSWSPKILCNLKTIKLKDIKYGGPSFSQLCAVLSASPSLAWLSIAAVGFPHEPSTLPPDPIHMQNLRKLQFSDIPLRITKGFLAAIRAPKCEFGGLEGDIRGDPFETFFTPEISHFFDHMRSGVTASSIRSNGHVATISWKGSWRITLDVNGTRAARRVLDWLSEPNSRAVPLHLTIDANNSRQVGEVLAVMVDAVDQVTFQYGAPVARALRVLATGSLVDGPAREPPHALKEVYIGKSLNDDEWEQLSSMLRQRQGEGGIGDQDLKPIRRLELDRLGYPYRELTEADINSFRLILWPNHLQEIRRLLGPEGELVWREKIVRQDGVLVDRCA